MAHKWVESNCSKALPANAIKGGYEDGKELYVGRFDTPAFVEVPAKVAPHLSNKAFTSYNGEEISSEKYDVLCGDKIAWMPSKAGELPKNAIVAGEIKGDKHEKLYIGRAFHGNNLINGSVVPNNGGLYLGYKGKEHIYKEYEILIDISH